MACLPRETRPRLFNFQKIEKLKLESRRKLDLAFAIQSAVRAGNLSESRVESQCISASGILCAVDAENVRAIENIKAFGKQFKIVSFGKSESFGKSNVQILHIRLTKSISLVNRQTSVA